MTDISPDMAFLIHAAQQGAATRSGNVVVPARLEKWAQEVLQKATPEEMKALDDTIRAYFERGPT